jgi:hypothetical protein
MVKKKKQNTWVSSLANRRLCAECNDAALADSVYCRRHDPRYTGTSQQAGKIPGRKIR